MSSNATQAPSALETEVRRRRTFAIISHPDAGKTTLTEKLLLYGGAIRLAGSVKARKAAHHAVSDWMEIEKQRGISVTSSAMAFDYQGFRINILDTPGHQDFSEDTYRTLVAADAAVMLIDGAKGVEAQTIKLFHVCRMRGIPIFTFVNKLDRAVRDPFELMEEIEQVLGIRTCPMNWPIGIDGDFQGVYHRDTKQVELFSGGDHGSHEVDAVLMDKEDPALSARIGAFRIEKLDEEIELLDMAGDGFDLEKVLRGDLSPLFFGSAMSNFGVAPFLQRFLSITPPPLARTTEGQVVEPTSDVFSGFIFKIQANMNPAHRDRLAFLRVCSGKFQKGMSVWHSGSGKSVKLAQPQQFMADEREAIEEAYAGDIIGLFDPGVFALGDTLTSGPAMTYSGIPLFAPEHFATVRPFDTMKRKQFVKGMSQLAEEGTIQVFQRDQYGMDEVIVGVVGALQFDVLSHRLKHEYGAELKMDNLPFRFVRWVQKASAAPEKLRLSSTSRVAVDSVNRPVILFENDWSIRWALENNDGLELSDMVPRIRL